MQDNNYEEGTSLEPGTVLYNCLIDSLAVDGFEESILEGSFWVKPASSNYKVDDLPSFIKII